MEIIPGLIMPLWSIIAVLSAAAIILVLIIVRTWLNYSFLKFCDKAANDASELRKFKSRYNDSAIARKSGLIIKSTAKNGTDFLIKTGLPGIWENQFIITRKIGYLKKIIRFFPEKGLFLCILGGKNRPAFERIFKKTTDQNSDLNLIKKIALESKGQNFDGEYAFSLFSENFQEIIELTGDAEWHARFFGIKLLLYSSDKRTERLLWEALHDSSSMIRKTVIEEFRTEDLKKFGDALKTILLDDPAFSVRKSARIRLDSDFPELYRIETADLSKPRIIHLLGQLHTDSDEDENIAVDYLLSEDLEIRLQAALFLQERKSLDRRFLSADMADKQEFERRKKLLTYACEVNCTSFLSRIVSTDNPASIVIAAELLQNYGSRDHIETLAAKVFNPAFRESVREHFFEIYEETIECISSRGSEKSMYQLKAELENRIDDESYFALSMPKLPVRGEYIFVPLLLKVLKAGSFSRPELLRETIRRFPVSGYIGELVSILRNTENTYSASVKKEAFKILGELKKPYCLQIILENLKLLETSEQKDFSVILKSFDDGIFAERAAGLLKSSDSEVKAALISALPSTGLKQFVQEIKDAAKDSDPDVRTASVLALAGYGEIKTISQMTSMLRDPVERVRSKTAEVIAEYGTPAALASLDEIIKDDNEVLPVKTASIRGLGCSSRVEATPILVEALEQEELRKTAIEALSEKTNPASIRQLVEAFKDASPELREHISDAFKAMGENCERPIKQLLEEDISSLRETLADILLKTGYIESTVTKLRHKKPVIRKEAAAMLALIQTREAFKGIVLAARDPDPDVRVEVLKALEKLNSKDGSELLESLKEDPDRRVRKYTLWALERLEAKNMDQ